MKTHLPLYAVLPIEMRDCDVFGRAGRLWEFVDEATKSILTNGGMAWECFHECLTIVPTGRTDDAQSARARAREVCRQTRERASQFPVTTAAPPDGSWNRKISS